MMSYALAAAQALYTNDIRFAGARFHVPGSMAIRLSTVLGNRRIHQLMDPFLTPGAVVVDAGANIGYNTVYAAQRVGPRGRVIAVEPAGDNLVVLRRNVAENAMNNVTIAAVAAGRVKETRSFYLRGDISAVNSFFEDSVYASVTDVVQVPVEKLDDLVDGEADLVKIDVEGAELDVLGGMTRLLESARINLVVEWHPLLQEKAGYDAAALPRLLLDLGFTLVGASHTGASPVTLNDVPAMIERLSTSGRPVDLLARRGV
ncbi:MAG: FkbM family methyltransferase [Vicinamibacterales bacterium]